MKTHPVKYDAEKPFNFLHHYEVSDNYLSILSFGREPTDAEKKKVIRENEKALSEMPKGHKITATLGTLPPLENASEAGQSE